MAIQATTGVKPIQTTFVSSNNWQATPAKSSQNSDLTNDRVKMTGLQHGAAAVAVGLGGGLATGLYGGGAVGAAIGVFMLVDGVKRGQDMLSVAAFLMPIGGIMWGVPTGVLGGVSGAVAGHFGATKAHAIGFGAVAGAVTTGLAAGLLSKSPATGAIAGVFGGAAGAIGAAYEHDLH